MGRNACFQKVNMEVVLLVIKLNYDVNMLKETQHLSQTIERGISEDFESKKTKHEKTICAGRERPKSTNKF